MTTASAPAPAYATRMFARVLGPYFVIAPIAATARASQMRELLTSFAASPLWPWIMGALVLLMGLTVVALHPYWNNLPAAIISVLGWIMVIRGVVLLSFPAAFMKATDAFIGSGALWQTGYIVGALIGLYLTFVGWWPTALPSPQRQQLG